MEAEEYAQVLAALRVAYDAAVTRHGGVVVRVQGDGMLAVFGYPQPTEGDGRRAVEATLELHKMVAQLPAYGPRGRAGALRLHSGIHAGMVLVQHGDMVLGRFELLGMAPNVASRLSDESTRDEILVSLETLGPDRFLFETGAERLVPVDRQRTLVACLPVLGPAAVGTPFDARARSGLQQFVGRHAEMRMLEATLGRALDGAFAQVVIAGPPGIGKTRLAEQFLQHALRRGCRVLKGYCDAELAAKPLQPLFQMIRSCAGLAPDAPPAQARAALRNALAEFEISATPLLPAMGLGAAGEADSPAAAESLLPALGMVFAAMAGRRPTVLFVDDWQWSDAATRQALAFIRSAAAAAPLMVLCSARSIDDGDATMHNVEVVDLQPFSADEATESIQALLPQVDPFVASEIQRYSGGNALFIEELCHSVPHQDLKHHLVRQHPTGAWLNVLVESRVARLPDEESELVRNAAVIGNVIPIWLLHELTGRTADDAALRSLAEKDFLFPDSTGTLRFKHGLTRDVIYESVGLHVRRALHLRIAQALLRHVSDEQEQPDEALAYHLGAAGRAAEAADRADIAGDRAAAVSALDRARTLYHAALAWLDEAAPAGGDVNRWLAIANKLGLICVFDASRKDLPVFQRGVELARMLGDSAQSARAEYWLGYVSYSLGDTYAALACCERASAVAGVGSDALAVQIRATLGQVRAAASQYGGALPLLEEAVAIKRAHRRGSRPAVGLAYSLVCLGSVVGDRGEFERARACFDEAMALLNGVTHEIGASIEGWRAVVLTWQGRWAEAGAAALESARIAEQTRSLFQFAQARATAAYAQWKHTGDPSWITRLEQANSWREPSESEVFRSLNYGWLAEGWMACGDPDRARAHAARALRRGRMGDLLGVGVAWRALAQAAADGGDAARARRCLIQAQRVAERRESPPEEASNLLCAAEVASALGDVRAARLHADSALATLEAADMRWHAQRARRLLDPK